MLNDMINHILPSVEHFRSAGYWIAFFAALLETTVGIGLFLPGSTIILFLGALSARGYLDTGDLIWFAVLGAIVGDNIDYHLGRKYGARWLERGFWFLTSDHIDKAKHFMNAHGAKSVFLGRFIPSVKEIVPFIAGSLKMEMKTFVLWNVLGAVGWGCEWVLAGYIFAQSLSLAQLWLSRAGLFFASLLLLGGILYLFKLLIIRKWKQFWIVVFSVGQSIQQALLSNEHVAPWLQKHQRGIAFLKARLDTTAFTGLPLSILMLALFYIVALFAGVVEDLITADPITAADIRIANLITTLRNDELTNVFSWITLLGKSQVILVFITVTVALLWIWRKKYYILPLFIAVTGSETFTCLGKFAFHRPRPEMAVYVEHSFSFPSGHATIAVSFYGFVGYLLIRLVHNWNSKVNIFFTTIIAIIAIGLSRIYLGVHYVSDIWSGYLVGAMWLVAAISVAEWLQHREESNKPTTTLSPVAGARPLSLALVFIALLFYSGFSITYHPPLAAKSAHNSVVAAKITDIFTNEQLKYTETLIGERQEPINFIILAEDDTHVVAALQQAGWVETEQTNLPSFIDALKALATHTKHPYAPLAPSFWNAKIQHLSFAKLSGKNWLSNAHHLKIWRTNYVMKNGLAIYVAMANGNDGLKWGIFPTISPNQDAERELLYHDLNRSGNIATSTNVQLVKASIGKNFIGDQFFSDGNAYIISIQ